MGFTSLGTNYAGAGDKTIIHLAEFQRKSLATVLVRMRPAGWDRWNGASWVTVPGALSNIATDRLYSVVQQDKLVVANRVDKLKYWDGVDADAVADLSADAPIAHYIAPFGQRLIAARINPGGGFDPYRIQGSEDGNIQAWTNAANGAFTTILEPEGKTGSPQFIKGLSALETAIVVYRDRSIVLGTRTGIAAVPFRWATVVFGLGTDASYAIANGGADIGDFFLGSDLNVYHFDGRSLPTPVGTPIVNILRTSINDPTACVAAIDRRYNLFWLFVATGSSVQPNVAWVFDINAYMRDNRLSWWRRDIGAGYNTIAFGATVSSVNPVVNSVTSVVNTVGSRVEDFGNTIQPQRLLLGGLNGDVYYLDEAGTYIQGIYETKQLGDLEMETRVDRVFLSYRAVTSGQVELSYSTDGGLSYGNPIVFTLPVTNYEGNQGAIFSTVLRTWQFKLRILSGNITITEIELRRAAAGRAAT